MTCWTTLLIVLPLTAPLWLILVVEIVGRLYEWTGGPRDVK